MALYKRGRIYWCDFRVNGQAICRSLRTDDKAEAYCRQTVLRTAFKSRVDDVDSMDMTRLEVAIIRLVGEMNKTRKQRNRSIEQKRQMAEAHELYRQAVGALDMRKRNG